jgi:hypothetical protein
MYMTGAQRQRHAAQAEQYGLKDEHNLGSFVPNCITMTTPASSTGGRLETFFVGSGMKFNESSFFLTVLHISTEVLYNTGRAYQVVPAASTNTSRLVLR